MPLNVVDLYNTIQGEGLHIGQQAIFLRLAKCNLACKFCDTDFESDAKVVDEHDIASRIFELHEASTDANCVNVVITGGEPLLQDLDPFFVTFATFLSRKKKGFMRVKYFVETNGLLYKPWIHRTCVTISPKTPVKKLHPLTLQHATVLKFLYGEKYPRFFEDVPTSVRTGKHMFIQPIIDKKNGKKNTTGALNYCMAHPEFRLSVQIHKIIGVK